MSSSGLSFQILQGAYLKVCTWRLSLIFALSISVRRSIKISSFSPTASSINQECMRYCVSLRWYGNTNTLDCFFWFRKNLRNCSISHFSTKLTRYLPLRFEKNLVAFSKLWSGARFSILIDSPSWLSSIKITWVFGP